jgi:hypothetical protein
MSLLKGEANAAKIKQKEGLSHAPKKYKRGEGFNL